MTCKIWYFWHFGSVAEWTYIVWLNDYWVTLSDKQVTWFIPKLLDTAMKQCQHIHTVIPTSTKIKDLLVTIGVKQLIHSHMRLHYACIIAVQFKPLYLMKMKKDAKNCISTSKWGVYLLTWRDKCSEMLKHSKQSNVSYEMNGTINLIKKYIHTKFKPMGLIYQYLHKFCS